MEDMGQQPDPANSPVDSDVPEDSGIKGNAASSSVLAEASAGAGVEKTSAAEQFWSELGRRRYVPPPIKRFARYRWGIATARAAEPWYRRRDADENEATRIPSGESVIVPAIWVTEIYTPTTLAGLLEGVPPMLKKTVGFGRDIDTMVESIRSARRRGGGSYLNLPPIYAVDNPALMGDRIIDELPVGVVSAQIGIRTLTATVTALTVRFRLSAERAAGLGTILNADVASKATPSRDGGHSVHDVSWQKQTAVDDWHVRLRTDSAAWLAQRFPGTFHRLRPGQPLAIELLVTERHRPWDEPTGEAGKRRWMRMLDLEDWDASGYWQCIPMPQLRLRQHRFHSWERHEYQMFTLGVLRAEFVDAFSQDPAEEGALNLALHVHDEPIVGVANHLALSALFAHLGDALSGTRDLADVASGSRSADDLIRLRRQLARTEMDGRIVVADLIRYAESGWAWSREVPDFREVMRADLPIASSARSSLKDTWRQSQVDDGNMIMQAESDLRDLLNTSAQLTGAAENLRLQRRVFWLTVMSVVVALVAAAAAVIALVISAHASGARSDERQASGLTSVPWTRADGDGLPLTFGRPR